MPTNSPKPIIFLAFANDRQDGVRYLRNLPKEARALQRILNEARREGLCELVLRQNITLQDIFDVFQDSEYRNRIAIFHFGGHANGYQLLLEAAEGQVAAAHASGLTAFLSQQTGLRLVFLNGCSTQAQTRGLLEAGIETVIATTQAIVDEVAVEFAIRFYQGLRSKATLVTAYKEAAAAIKTAYGDNTRSLYWADEEVSEDRPPWELYPSLETEEAHQWSLLTDGVLDERTMVAAYLQEIIDTIGPEREYNPSRSAAELSTRLQQPEADKLLQKRVEALRRLWQQDFCVHERGKPQISQRSLKEATQDLLDSKRPAGDLRRAVALLSDAGVGKTPALKRMLAEIAEKSLPHCQTAAAEKSQNRDALIPLLIPLAELRADQPFLTLVRVAFNRYAREPITLDQAEELLKKYDCLLLLDDLDKVTYDARSSGIKIIREFMDNYPQERYLISCRTNGYHRQLGPMEAYVLEELSDDQVRNVLGDEYDESLLPLARNRSMLKIMITEGQQDNIRWSRGRLLKRMIWTKLDMRETETDSQQEMIEALLERLAYQMHQDRVYHYSEQQLMEFITSHLAEWHESSTWREMTQRFRYNEVMIPDERRQWRFVNRSTQAYFVAAAINRSPALLSLVLEYASDFWWREPLEILVGLRDEPSELVFELIDRDPLVAIHCVQFVGQLVKQEVVKSLIDALVEQMRYERAPGREQLIRLVSKTGYLPPEDLLWQLFYREQKSLVLMALARALTDANLRRKQYNFSPIPETETINIDPSLLGVILFWQEYILTPLDDVKSTIEAELIRLLRSDKEKERVRGLAAIALGYIGIEVSRVKIRKVLLAELKRSRLNQFVAWCVTDALSQIKHEAVEQAAIELYQQHRSSPDEIDQRRCVYAVYLLGGVGGRFEETATILYEGLDSTNKNIKGYAASSLGRLGPIEARERLEEQLASRNPKKPKQDPWVLRRMVEALSKVGTLESIQVIEPYLRHEQRRTRQRAREAITEIRRRYELI